ncbi:MAG: hypothetical protein DMF68_08700 [Acidobacteria bacterium]|nr:MAG: hypothetical protein DMF68_08700 [Acidobacteriota bacterium]
MHCSNALVKINDVNAKPRGWSRAVCEDSTVRLITAEDEREALRFLSSRPVHTINLRAFIRDNGMTSALNRGEFYGYRNPKGELEGVALIGHATLVEASTDRALEALARRRKDTGAHTWSRASRRG